MTTHYEVYCTDVVDQHSAEQSAVVSTGFFSFLGHEAPTASAGALTNCNHLQNQQRFIRHRNPPPQP